LNPGRPARRLVTILTELSVVSNPTGFDLQHVKFSVRGPLRVVSAVSLLSDARHLDRNGVGGGGRSELMCCGYLATDVTSCRYGREETNSSSYEPGFVGHPVCTRNYFEVSLCLTKHLVQKT
jgi:hypothetical protein